jgi:hypothetical protein
MIVCVLAATVPEAVIAASLYLTIQSALWLLVTSMA